MDLNVALALAGLALLGLGLLSRVATRICLSPPLLALALGLLVGPEVLGAVDPAADIDDERKVLEETARLTLAVALMGTGLQITRADLRENGRRALRLLTVGMAAMWLTTTLGAWLLLDLSFLAALLLGAILTPTDPVVASSIVSGPLARGNLPRRLRRTLTIEAGANDGLALPFVLLAALLLLDSSAATLPDWAWRAAKEVGIALATGGVLGTGSAWLYRWGVEEDEVDEKSLLGAGIALALAALGLTHLLGGSGVLASFVAALAFSARLPEAVRAELGEVQEAIARFFLLPALILFGALLPWEEWSSLGIAGLAFVAWALLVRRPAAVALALARSDTAPRERLFLGWFGPLGVAAIFYATYIDRFALAPGDRRTIFAAATLAIATSVAVHSLTATPGTRLFARRPALGTVRHPLTAAPEEKEHA